MGDGTQPETSATGDPMIVAWTGSESDAELGDKAKKVVEELGLIVIKENGVDSPVANDPDVLKQEIEAQFWRRNTFPPVVSNAYADKVVGHVFAAIESETPGLVARVQFLKVGVAIIHALGETAARLIHGGADPVMLFNGQFVHTARDLHINGSGIDFDFVRTYKSQVLYRGPLGQNWDHSYNLWLRVSPDQREIARSTGTLREDTYIRHDVHDYWVPPIGVDSVIVQEGNQFVVRTINGTRFVYRESPQDPSSPVRVIDRIEDRFGNFLRFEYDDSGLRRVQVNHPQRIVQFAYDELGRILAISDYSGRTWRYVYDEFEDLIAVTTPRTNERPEGNTVCYEYSSAEFAGALQHNLTRIIDADGRVYLENEYGTAAGVLNYNRVVRQRQGGGLTFFEYEDVIEEFEFDYRESERPAHQTNVTERNGHPVHYIYNRAGNLLFKEEYVLSSGTPRLLKSYCRYNSDGNLVATMSAEGAVTQYLYGRDYFARTHQIETEEELVRSTELTARVRQGFGCLLAVVRRGRYYKLENMNLARGVWGDIFPDIITGFDPDDAITKFTYEASYGQLLSASDPRFTSSADPAIQSAALGEHPRYEEMLTRYSYKGPATAPASDPFLLPAEVRKPTPTLPDGTVGGPVVHRFETHDPRGRLLRSIDATGTATVNVFFASGLREGYLQRTVVDPGALANTTEYEVDSLGRITAVHLPRSFGAPPGHFITRTVYNELDQVIATSKSDVFPSNTRRYYDRSGKLIREERDAKDENGADIPGAPEVRTYAYDEELNLIKETLGGADTSAHVESQHRYDSSGKRVLTILPKGNKLGYRYDERLLPTARLIGVGTSDVATTRVEYDGDGRVKRTIDARGNPKTFSLDALGRVIATEDALGNVTRLDYDKLDHVTVQRVFENRADGYYLLARSEVRYDELGRSILHLANRFEQFPGPLAKGQLGDAFLQAPIPGGDVLVAKTFYDAGNQIVRVEDALQRATTFEYDALGRLRATTDVTGNQTIQRYDEHGNVIRRDSVDLERDPNNPTAVIGQRVFSRSFAFDELDRMVTSTDSLGNATTFAYDSRNNVARQADPLGNSTRMSYDIRNRLVLRRAELTQTGLGGSGVEATANKKYDYDRNGNLVGLTDSLGRRVEYAFDALDRCRTVQYPDGSTYSFDYDGNGRVVRTKDNNGLQQHHTIDPLGRAIRIDVDTSEVTQPEIAGATFKQYAFDALDRRYLEENDFATCETRFNSLGWPVAETTTVRAPGAPLNTSLVIERTFDDVGALVGLVYPNGREVAFDRDALDRLIRIRNVAKGADYPGSSAAPDAEEITKVDYAGRQRVHRRNGNGTFATYAHDGAARVIQIEHRTLHASLLKIQYLSDGANNVRRRNEVTQTQTTGEVFAYDSLQRLVDQDSQILQLFNPSSLAPSSIVRPDPLPRDQDAIDVILGSLALPTTPHTYEYDLVGSRIVERGATQLSYTTNELDQYTQIVEGGGIHNFVYDANGNLKSDGARSYVYDFANRLVKVSEGSIIVAQFFHDARGRRIMETVDGSTTQFVYDRFNLISEYRHGVLSAHYVYGDGTNELVQIAARRTAPIADGDEHWYHADSPGSVRLLTDRNGDQVIKYQYEPFGRIRGTIPDEPYNPFLYIGARYDSRFGTYDFRYRQYDPLLGRFLQRDPLGIAGGANLYTYADNAPLALIDPFGTEARPEMDLAAASRSYGTAGSTGGTTDSAYSNPSAKVSTAVSVSQYFFARAMRPLDINGQPLKGTYYLWSGKANLTAAETTINNTRSGWLMKQTPQHIAAIQQELVALRREAATLFPGQTFTDAELTAMAENKILRLPVAEHRGIWDAASKDVANQAALSGTPVQKNLVSPAGPDTVQTRIERPAVARGGLIMGGLQIGAGALNVYGGLREENAFLRALGVGGGGLQIAGGASWIYGASRASPAFVSVGSKVCVAAAVATAPITIVHAVNDLRSDDPARNVIGAESAVGVVVPPVGVVAAYSEIFGTMAAEKATEVVGRSTSSDWSQIVGGPMAW